MRPCQLAKVSRDVGGYHRVSRGNARPTEFGVVGLCDVRTTNVGNEERSLRMRPNHTGDPISLSESDVVAGSKGQ